MYVRIIAPEYRSQHPTASDPPLTWARVEGATPRGHLVIVVTPLRESMTKLPAFAIPLEDCGLKLDDIGKITTTTRPQLRTIRETDKTTLPDIDYIAQDMGSYNTENEVQDTADQWIFAWFRGQRIVTTQTPWKSVWSNRNRGEDAIIEYYHSCGVPPPQGPRSLGERIRLQGLGVRAGETPPPVVQPQVNTAREPVNSGQQDIISTIQSLIASLSLEQRQELLRSVPPQTRLPSPPEDEL